MLTGKTLSNIQGDRKHKSQAVFLGWVLSVSHPFTHNCRWLSPHQSTPHRHCSERSEVLLLGSESHPILLLEGPKIEGSWVSFVPTFSVNISLITAKPHAQAKQEMSKEEIVCSLAASPCAGGLHSSVENHVWSYVTTVQTNHSSRKHITLFSAGWQISHQKKWFPVDILSSSPIPMIIQ